MVVWCAFSRIFHQAAKRARLPNLNEKPFWLHTSDYGFLCRILRRDVHADGLHGGMHLAALVIYNIFVLVLALKTRQIMSPRVTKTRGSDDGGCESSPPPGMLGVCRK